MTVKRSSVVTKKKPHHKYDRTDLKGKARKLLPDTAPPTILSPDGRTEVIKEPYGSRERPAEGTSMFVLLYLSLYKGQLFTPYQWQAYETNSKLWELNEDVRRELAKLPGYKLMGTRFSRLPSELILDAIQNIHSEHPLFKHFDGGWGARWLLRRSWASRTRNLRKKKKCMFYI